MIVKCWAIVAKCSQLASKTTLTNNDYDELAINLKKEREVLIEVKFMYDHDINSLKMYFKQLGMDWKHRRSLRSDFIFKKAKTDYKFEDLTILY
ncbi:unnamed protein product [Rhizophagus irregularis]|nr:unnamed protein product [Rhizophagus irregularis]